MRAACGVASKWKVIESAPALDEVLDLTLGALDHQVDVEHRRRLSCTCSRSASTTSGPIVIGGTKWPSITSTWMTRAPASRTSWTCSRSRPKSAERIEGATRTPRRSSRATSDRLKHALAAVVALDDRRAGHAHDRRVLTAVRAHRGELVAVQAVDAAVAAGQVGRPQPRLAAVRAGGTEVHPGSPVLP